MPKQITTLPTPAPNRGMDEEQFTNAADALVGALPEFVSDTNEVAVEINDNAVIASNAATTATTKANEAAASAQSSASSAQNAVWNAATNYAVNVCVIDPNDYHTYRRKVAGVSATAPSLDSVNWQPLSRLIRRAVSIVSSATPAPNCSSCEQFNITALAATASIATPSGVPYDGQTLIIRIKDNGTARGLSFGSGYRASPDLALPFTTVAGKTMYMGFIYNAADAKWDLTALLNNV